MSMLYINIFIIAICEKTIFTLGHNTKITIVIKSQYTLKELKTYQDKV